ncbi:MAG TPA: prepilin peptidase [Candidatus Paceibacterota bacterium]|nr:prepilin peptidase [Candidatus Paceibacterota bacterium]
MILYLFSLFVLGAIIGSFLNVVVLRFGTGASFIRGRSKCFSCGHTLSTSDLFPILSFILLGGKCRYCKSKISSQYVLVETTTAVLFALAGYCIGVPENIYQCALFVLSLIIISFYVAIAIYDIRHQIIPDGLSYGAAFFALIYTAVIVFSGGEGYVRFLAGFLCALPFFLLWLLSRGKWMGLGDPKLALSLGWWLGISGGIASLCLAVWSGAIFGVFVLIGERMKKGSVRFGRHEIPFGPFIILGAIAAYLFGITLATLIGAV